MAGSRALRVAIATAGVGMAPALAFAQAWGLLGGVITRGEYNDNYFFTPTNAESAFTGSITPFLTAARRTETTDVTALFSVGANRVWGVTPTTDYLSAHVAVDGSWRQERSTLAGNVSYVRAPTLQPASGQAGGPLILAFTNGFSANGTYTYAYDERLSLSAIAGAYDNSYSGVAAGSAFSNNHGYTASGNAGYVYSDKTKLSLLVGYSSYFSGSTDSNAIITTIGVVHQISDQLAVSGSIGGFWSDLATQPTALAPGTRFHDSGALYGGNVIYSFSDRSQLTVNVNEYLAPSSFGSLTKTLGATASLTHQFSDRLTGRLGAGYSRIDFPVTVSSFATNEYATGEVGLSYMLTERWLLDAGYRYSRANYAQTAGTPTSNMVFVSIGYNWPGQSFTDWVGRPVSTQGLPGAGPVALPESGRAPAESATPDRSPFEPFTIP